MRARWMRWILAAMAAWGMTFGLRAQDTRTVTEPVFPPVCTVLTSQTAIVSGQPASETVFDTSRIQTALTACGSGKAVELASTGANYAFLIAPITIPSGVSLIVDGGVTVFASRNPADYQTSSTELCGTYGASGNGCNNLIGFVKNETGSGVYGYGVIDGRGGSTMLKGGVDSGISWWTNADQANTAGQSQDNFIIMKPSNANNMVLYKITFRNSPMFHIGWSGTGFTAWGVKIQAPYTAHNTDGIDPDGTNITVTNSSISDGDDDVAVGASSKATNITISNVTTYSGHGISVGSYTQGGLSNMLVQNVNMAGTAQDTNATGIRLKSAVDRGGLIQNVTYSNMCLRDMKHILQFTPFYNTNTGNLIPQFSNITLQNIHFLTPTTNQYPYLVQMQGHDANYPASVTLNNVVFDTLLAGNVTPASTYINYTLAGNVYPAFLQSLPGTGVTYTGSATSTATDGALACPSSVFPYVVGELFVSTASATSLQSATIASTGTVTLNAMVQPAMSQTAFSGTVGNYTGASALVNPINFLEGSTVVGAGTLGANGTLASLTLSGVSAGTHTYTAQYPADTHYAALNFGSVTVTVTAPIAVATTTTLSGGGNGAYGVGSTLTATVAPVSGSNVPTGQVQFFDGTTVIATVSMSGGSASTTQVLAGGSHSLMASYLGDTGDLTSTSAAKAMTVSTAASTATLTALPAAITLGASTVLTAQVSGVAAGSNPGGTATFYDGATSLGTAALSASGAATKTVTPTSVATHSYTVSYGGDTNYATVTSAAASVVVSQAATTTALTATPASVVYGTGTLLTATVSTATGVPTGTVKFVDGVTLLATVTVASGVASTTQTLAVGSHSVTAVYSGDTSYSGSTSAGAAATVTAAATATGLTLSGATTYVGGSVTLTATVSSSAGVPGGSVTFANGATMLGSAMLNGSGVATLTVSESVAGVQTITATYAANGSYLGSASTSSALTVVAPVALSSSTLSASLAAGGSVPVTITATPGGAFTGAVTFTCSSPVSYITCTPATGSQTVSGATPVSFAATISVAASVSAVRQNPVAWLAALLPLSLLGLRRRRMMKGLALLVMMAGLMGLGGCGASSGAASTVKLPPAGTQVVTITATAAGVSATSSITVTITN